MGVSVVIIIAAVAVWLVASVPTSLAVGWWLRRGTAASDRLSGPVTPDSALLRADTPRTDAA
jgi:hypothetical protein